MKASRVHILLLLALCPLFLSVVFPANAQDNRAGIAKVVLDAGHGGKDPGTVYQGYREKDITLSVALRLGALIRENHPEVQVIYTRKTDVLIPLDERGNIANKAGADLFISIHVNGARNSAASGTETFVMGVDKSGGNLEIAMKENDVITYEKDYTTSYEGYKPGDAESFIIFSLMQYSYEAQSLNFANQVQKQYVKNSALANRGVKQAGFLVLWRTSMPSVLTELGFLSNPDDRKILTTANGQEKLARSLFNAFSEYKTKTEGKGRMIVLDNSDLHQEEETLPPDVQNTAVSTENGTRSAANQPVANTGPSPQGTIEYRIQVMSSPTKVAKNSSRFGIYRGQVTELIVNNRYKYFTGSAATYEEALSLQRKVREAIPDAFVVPFRNARPISMDEARRTK